MKMSMSNERMDRGPIGSAHPLSEEAERQASGAAKSRSEARAEAVGGRLQALVRPCCAPDSSPAWSPLALWCPFLRDTLTHTHGPTLAHAGDAPGGWRVLALRPRLLCTWETHAARRRTGRRATSPPADVRGTPAACSRCPPASAHRLPTHAGNALRLLTPRTDANAWTVRPVGPPPDRATTGQPCLGHRHGPPQPRVPPATSRCTSTRCLGPRAALSAHLSRRT